MYALTFMPGGMKGVHWGMGFNNPSRCATIPNPSPYWNGLAFVR